MNARATLACALAAALAGCQSGPASTAPQRPSSAAEARPAASVMLHGTATYLERIKMPPGASLRVEALDAASGAALATTTMPDVAGPPIPFSIALPANTGTARGVALRATLLGPQGEPWFETPAPVAATPGGGSVEIRMRRVANPATPAPAASNASITHWECGELGVMSRYEADASRVRLSFNGHLLELPLARSASGARYADARGNEFWTKGATGTLALAGEQRRDCVQAAQASPWNAAVLRGAAFRAVGNEPGWYAEIAGESPMLDADLDYGERRMRIPLRATPDGYVSTDAAQPVRLRIARRLCEDGMSGQRFEAAVTLESGGRTYRGCGGWLQD